MSWAKSVDGRSRFPAAWALLEANNRACREIDAGLRRGAQRDPIAQWRKGALPAPHLAQLRVAESSAWSRHIAAERTAGQSREALWWGRVSEGLDDAMGHAWTREYCHEQA